MRSTCRHCLRDQTAKEEEQAVIEVISQTKELKLGKGTDLFRIIVAKKKLILTFLSLEFAGCYLYRFMSLEKLKRWFLPQNLMMYNEHTRDILAICKKMLCNTYVYNFILISSGFRVVSGQAVTLHTSPPLLHS